MSVWSCATWTIVRFTQVFHPAFIWAFVFSARVYLSPVCRINTFEEEYHFEDERSAVLLCKQPRQKFETGKRTYKELCFIDEPFPKESSFQAPGPLIPPAQKGIVCMWVCIFYIFIYRLPDSGCSFWDWVSLHTLCKQSLHCSKWRPVVCLCVFFLLKRTLINSP